MQQSFLEKCGQVTHYIRLTIGDPVLLLRDGSSFRTKPAVSPCKNGGDHSSNIFAGFNETDNAVSHDQRARLSSLIAHIRKTRGGCHLAGSWDRLMPNDLLPKVKR